MNSSTIEILEVKAQDVKITDEELTIDLTDGRTISAPLMWYPRLMYGTKRERNNWQFIGEGVGIHWPDIDEDISVEGVMLGKPSYESQKSVGKWLKNRARKRK